MISLFTKCKDGLYVNHSSKGPSVYMHVHPGGNDAEVLLSLSELEQMHKALGEFIAQQHKANLLAKCEDPDARAYIEATGDWEVEDVEYGYDGINEAEDRIERWVAKSDLASPCSDEEWDAHWDKAKRINKYLQSLHPERCSEERDDVDPE